MHFAYSLPWWLWLVLLPALGTLAFLEYRRPLVPLTSVQRSVLVACRALALAAIVVFLLRPIVLLPPASARDAVVPVLVDVSQSMRLPDGEGQARFARATTILRTQLLPALGRQFRPEVYSVRERLSSADVDHIKIEARRTELAGALAADRPGWHGQRVVGHLVSFDGGDAR